MAKIICDPTTYWQGNVQLLNDYVVKAAACGASFFKLQLFNPSYLMGEKWKEKKKFYEHNFVNDALLQDIKDKVETFGMQFMATINYADAATRCNKFHVKNIKIASGQIVEPIIAAVTSFKWKKIFVSTGMLDDEIALQMIPWMTDVAEEVVVMHCTSLYPTEYSEAHLNRIIALREHFKDHGNITIGYSDHCYDNLPLMFALGMGVPYIERHFKVSGAFGPTIEVASDEQEFAELCMAASQQEKILGKVNLKMMPREQESIDHYKNRYMM